MAFNATVGYQLYNFENLRVLLAKASPIRNADRLSGVAAQTESERIAAMRCLAVTNFTRLFRFEMF